MKQNNLLNQIETISKKECGLTDFTKFLEGSEAAIIRLWQFILNCDGRYTDSREDRTLAFSSIFKKTTVYDESRMRHLIKLLRIRMTQFIFLNRLENTAAGQRFCAEIYQSIGDLKKMKEANDNALKMASEEAEITKHFLKWEINRDRHFYGNNETSGITKSFKNSDQELDNFYLVAKLKNIIEELSVCRIYNNVIDYELKKKIRLLPQIIPEYIIPLISVQLSAINYYCAPTREIFDKFKNDYFENINLLHFEKQYLLISLINAFIVLPGEKSREECLIFYKFGLEHNLLIQNGKISSIRFNNFIFVAESLKNYNIIELVVNKLGTYIDNDREKNRSLLIANAYVFFGKKKYDKAMELLSELDKCKGLPFYFVLQKYILEFKCAFEKFEDKQMAYLYLKSKEGNFRKRLSYFIKNKDIDETCKTKHLNFFNLLCKISNKKSFSTAILKKFAKINGEIMEIEWIREKVDEIT